MSTNAVNGSNMQKKEGEDPVVVSPPATLDQIYQAKAKKLPSDWKENKMVIIAISLVTLLLSVICLLSLRTNSPNIFYGDLAIEIALAGRNVSMCSNICEMHDLGDKRTLELLESNLKKVEALIREGNSERIDLTGNGNYDIFLGAKSLVAGIAYSSQFDATKHLENGQFKTYELMAYADSLRRYIATVNQNMGTCQQRYGADSKCEDWKYRLSKFGCLVAIWKSTPQGVCQGEPKDAGHATALKAFLEQEGGKLAETCAPFLVPYQQSVPQLRDLHAGSFVVPEQCPHFTAI